MIVEIDETNATIYIEDTCCDKVEGLSEIWELVNGLLRLHDVAGDLRFCPFCGSAIQYTL